jgi:hypothetical protein
MKYILIWCGLGIVDINADLLPAWLAMHPFMAIRYSEQKNEGIKIPMAGKEMNLTAATSLFGDVGLLKCC